MPATKTVSEAATLLGVTEPTIYRYVQRRQLDVSRDRPYGPIRISDESLRRMAARAGKRGTYGDYVARRDHIPQPEVDGR